MMFESHVTVSDIPVEDFKHRCKTLQVKPVFIENDSGGIPSQLMTAKFHGTSSLEQALVEMYNIANAFPAKCIIRKKLEYIGSKPPCEVKYFEFHSKFKVSPARLEEFTTIVRKHNSHISTNVFSPGFAFATSRDLDTHLNLRLTLGEAGYKLVNTIRESVIYDDNESIDYNWGCLECPLKLKVF